ncbi:MAG: hypothetical protein MJ123_05970 [Lachnospiraceae bacterium]|nr:hypothetical protein [Lachnospiraceae bacterium]
MFNKSKVQNDIVTFFIGLVMLVVGLYLFMQNVEVTTANIFTFSMFGHRMDGLIFLPLIASIIYIFFSYNKVSKTCFFLSIVLIIVNVIMNLRLYWNTQSLFVTIIIFILLFGGGALVMKTIFVNPNGKHGRDYTNGK